MQCGIRTHSGRGAQGVLFVSLGRDVSLITDHPVGLKDEPQSFAVKMCSHLEPDDESRN